MLLIADFFNELQSKHRARLIAALFVPLFLSGCFKAKVSLQSTYPAETPLPDRYFLYSANEKAPTSILYGTVHGSRYTVESHPAYQSVRFTTFEPARKHYWAEIKTVDEKKEDSFLNFLVNIKNSQLLLYTENDGSVASSTELLRHFEKALSGDPATIIEYKIYDLNDSTQRAEAERISIEVAEKARAKGRVQAQERAARAKGKKFNPDINQNTWITVDSSLRNKLLNLGKIDGEITLDSRMAAETQDLPFYNNTKLIRISNNWKPANLRLYFLYDGKEFHRLNGTSPVIHAFNKSNKVKITDDTVTAYLWFFGFFVRGEHGPFLIINSLTDTYFPLDQSDPNRKTLADQIKPVNCSKNSDASFSCKTHVYYSNAVFQADMKVLSDGNVEMTSDNPVADNLAKIIDAPLNKTEAGERFSVATAPKKAPPKATAPTSKATGKWVFKESVDAITDAKKQYVFGWPEGSTPNSGGPYIRIGCYGSSDRWPMGVTLFWGTPLEDVFPSGDMDMARVTTRFGTQSAMELGWSVAEDWQSTYPPDAGSGALSQMGSGLLSMLAPGAALSKMNFTWTPKQLHSNLRANNKVVFRGYPRSGRDMTLVFDTTDYAGAASNFKSHCNR